MLSEQDNFYLQKEEPLQGCLLAMRDYILQSDPHITEAWKYKMPFFCYKGKMLCYLWTKKNGQPYLGIVDGNMIPHPALVQEKRSRMKILLLDAGEDLPLGTISAILKTALKICENKHRIKNI
jgi:hypothetical protein